VKTIIAGLFAVLTAVPVAAQSQSTPDPAAFSEPYDVSFRGFFVATEQSFAAKRTFEAAFGKSTQPFFGGGFQVTSLSGFYIEFGVTRFKKTGQRAFINNGQTFELGIPLTATITPIEFSAGYRFGARSWKVIPYAAGGIGRYNYREESDFAADGDNVDTHAVGYLATGGVEFRLHKWIGVAVDAQYTHVPDILGQAGVSKDAGETNLGGIAARFKVLIGR
jgi:outer membrane protein with beta-barrel domain